MSRYNIKARILQAQLSTPKVARNKCEKTCKTLAKNFQLFEWVMKTICISHDYYQDTWELWLCYSDWATWSFNLVLGTLKELRSCIFIFSYFFQNFLFLTQSYTALPFGTAWGKFSSWLQGRFSMLDKVFQDLNKWKKAWRESDKNCTI